MIFIWRPLFARLDVVVNNAGYGDIRRSNSAEVDQKPPVDGKVCTRDVGSIVREQNAMAVATSLPPPTRPSGIPRSGTAVAGWIWQSRVYYSNIQT
jgi:hypothetical protein